MENNCAICNHPKSEHYGSFIAQPCNVRDTEQHCICYNFVDGRRVEDYLTGRYQFKVPPVSTGNWNQEDWIRYIDLNNGWVIKWN